MRSRYRSIPRLDSLSPHLFDNSINSKLDLPPQTYKLIQFSPGASFLLNHCWPANGLVTLSGHSAEHFPRVDLLKAHATLARIWNSLGMEHEFQTLLAIKSQSQLEPDGSIEIPAHLKICAIV